MAAETRGLGSQVDSMEFCGDLLNEILGVKDREGRTPTTESIDTGDCHHSGMYGELKSFDT